MTKHIESIRTFNESASRLMKNHFDWTAIIIGVTSILICLVFHQAESAIENIFISISGALGIIFILNAALLFFFDRALFDWYMIQGKFMRKVCCLVVLTPFVIASFSAETSPADMYSDNYEITQEDNLFWTIFIHYVDPGLQNSANPDNSGRKLAAVVGILGIFLLNGLLVTSFIDYIGKRKENWLKGNCRYDRLLKREKHHVIIGGNDMVAGIIGQLKNTDNCYYILVQTSREVEEFRRELFSAINDESLEKRIIIYYGDRTSGQDIQSLKLNKAASVHVLGEEARSDDNESYHDILNMKCIELITEECRDFQHFHRDKENDIDRRLTCRVMFEHQTIFSVLQTTDIVSNRIKFLPFNYYEMWAQKVLVNTALPDETSDGYIPLEGFEGIKENDDEFVHLVVAGMSRMGVALGVEAAHIAHYPNFENKSIKKRTRITFIDPDPEQFNHFTGRFKSLFSLAPYRFVTAPSVQYNFGTARIYNDTDTYPWINPVTDPDSRSPFRRWYLGGDFIDIEWEFIKGSISEPSVQQYLDDAASNPEAKLTVAICLPEDNRSIASAAYLSETIYEKAKQILVYQRKDSTLIEAMSDCKRYHKKIKAFGMSSDCYAPSLISVAEYISDRISEAYAGYYDIRMLERYNIRQALSDNDYKSLTSLSKIEELIALKKAEGKDTSGEEQKLATAIARRKELWDSWFAGHNLFNENWTDEIKKRKKEIDAEMKGIIGREDIKEAGSKPEMAKIWSNYYNIYTIWTKFRCCDKFDLSKGFSPEELVMAGKMEHNRWNMEQLLMRYRPLTYAEQHEARILKIDSSSKKNEYKKNRFAHLDICSNGTLDSIDYMMSDLDKYLINVIPEAYKEWMSINKN